MRALEAHLAHLIEVGQTVDLFVLFLQQHLNQEHLSLLFDQVPSVLAVFWSLYRHIEPSSLSDVDFVSDVRVNGECSWLDVGFAELSETAFSSRSVFLPNLKLLVLDTLALFPCPLLVLEGEYLFVARLCERILHLLEPQLRPSIIIISVTTSV